jgi:hypothetical protein
MTNDLVVTRSQALAQAAVEEGAKGVTGPILKHVKGCFSIDDNNVPLGTEYIAHVTKWARGWTKFVDGVPSDQRLGLVVDGFKIPDRAELGDLDVSEWDVGPDGRPRDPWVRQSYLPLENRKTGEIITFVSGSKGGATAIADLAALTARNNGEPIVRLSSGAYRHKVYGRIAVPEFTVIGWSGATMVSSAPAADFNDSMEF